MEGLIKTLEAWVDDLKTRVDQREYEIKGFRESIGKKFVEIQKMANEIEELEKAIVILKKGDD